MQRRRQLIAWAAAAAGPGLVTAAGLLGGLDDLGAAALFLLPVALAAALAGLWPGLLAGALSFVGLLWITHHVVVALPVAAAALVLVLAREHREREAARRALTRREELIRALEESEERIRSVLESTVDGIVVIDERGIVQVFNRACETLFGYRADEVVGRNVAMLMPEPHRGAHDDYLERYRQTGEARIIGLGREVLGRRSDGTTFPFDLSVSELHAGDGLLFTGVVHDLTERKRVEGERERALDRERFLAEATQLLGESLDSARTLAALARLVVSHLADWCAVDLVAGDGSIERVTIAHADPAKVKHAEEVRRRYPPDPAAPSGTPNVVRTGQSELYEEIPDELLARLARDEQQLELIRGLGLRSAMVVPLPARGRVLGAITLVSAESGRRYDADDLRFAQELARRAALAIDNARLHESERGARRAAEISAAATARLQNVTAALSGAITPEDVAGMIVEQGVSALEARAGAVYVLDEEGAAFQLLGQVGYPPELAEQWDAFPADMPGPAGDAVRTGELISVSSPEEMEGRWPNLAGTRERVGDRAALAAPLVLQQAPGGVLYFAFPSARSFSEQERDLVSTLASQCSQALERARLYERELDLRQRAERASGRMARLQSVTAALAQALTRSEVADVLIEQGKAALGAKAVWASVLADGGRELELLAQTGYAGEFVETYRRIPMSAKLAIVQTVKDGRARWYGSVDEQPDSYPELAESRAATGTQALALLPLTGRGRASGVVAFRFLEAREFDAEDRALLTTIVGHCSQALERATLYEREHRVAETLQRSLLPVRLPELGRAELAGRYMPGSPGLEVGGDWYDAFELADGWLAVSIGDVVGHGVQAASVMGQLRNALRAYVLEGYGPSEALGRLNRLVADGDEWFATLVLALFDPRTGFLRFASAGHPPPLLCPREGRPALLEGGRSVPLGALPDARYVEETLVVEPDATFVLYTDGLVEGPGIPLEEGLQQLVEAAADAPRELEGLLDHLAGSLATQRRRPDDVALVALRARLFRFAPLRIRTPAEPASLASIRVELRGWLEQLELEAAEENHILVACGEACTNAIEHSRSADVEVEARTVDGDIHLFVRDSGRWQESVERRDRGLGLNLIEAFMDEVDVQTGPRGTEVRMVRHAPVEAARR